MKITGLETFIVAPRWCFLKISTDEGGGWGEPVLEGRAHTVAAAVEELADYLIGRIHRLSGIGKPCTAVGFIGVAAFTSAIAGIDQALWDIKGKFHDTPVHQLLGGQVRDRIRVYAWVGGDRPADIVNSAQRAISDGFKATKMNLTEEMQIVDSHSKIDDAVERIAHLREAVGSAGYCRGLSRTRACTHGQALIHAIEPYSPLFVEEPVLSEHLDAMAECAGILMCLSRPAKTVLPFRFQKPVYPWRCGHHPADLSTLAALRMQKIADMAETWDIALAPHCRWTHCLAACLQSAVCQNALFKSRPRYSLNQANDLTHYLDYPRFSPFRTASLASPRPRTGY